MPQSDSNQIGAYRLYDRIGRGGFATVYLARDIRTNEIVAVKILHSHIAQDADFIARFRHEADILRRIPRDQNLVHLHEFGQVNGVWFLAMDYLEGKDLAQILTERKRLPVNEALAITTQIARALDVAYRNGLIHRDIKPANIKLTPEGIAKVMDFGLARAAEGTRLTQASMFIGTPDYMAPEIWEGKPADIRSDLYALGAVTYEMLVGSAPFHSNTPAAIMRRHLVDNPAPLRALRPDVPPRVETIVHKLMAKQPDARYQTPGELRAALKDEVNSAVVPPVSPARSGVYNRTLWLTIFGIIAIGVFAILAVVGLTGQFNPVPVTPVDEWGFVAEQTRVTRTPRATFTVKPPTVETDIAAIRVAVETVTNTPTQSPTAISIASATPTRTRVRATAVPSEMPTMTLVPTPTFLPSGFKYRAPMPIEKNVNQIGGQVHLTWIAQNLASTENYFIEINAGEAWSGEYIVCSLLTSDSQILLPPSNSPPCRTELTGKVGPYWWWHDDYNYGWRISIVETDGNGKILGILSDYDGGYIFWKHQ